MSLRQHLIDLRTCGAPKAAREEIIMALLDSVHRQFNRHREEHDLPMKSFREEIEDVQSQLIHDHANGETVGRLSAYSLLCGMYRIYEDTVNF